MARSSSAVLRAAAILDFVAEHPGQSFSMVELVSALRISHSTCHSLISALVDVGYLFRTSQKTYALGPRLASIARAAQDNSSLLEMAKPELRRIANRLDLVCSALVREGPLSVVRERSTSARHVGYAVQIGMTLRLRAPLAAAFFVSSPEKAAEWLSQLGELDVVAERETMRQGIDFLRAHGFVVLLNNPAAARTAVPIDALFDGAVDQLKVSLMLTISEQEPYSVSSIVTPVFDAAGDVAFVLSLIGHDNPVAGAQVRMLGQELKAASTRISAYVMDDRRRDQLLPV